MSVPIRVLIIEDSEDDAALLVRELRRGGYETSHERVETAVELSAALDRQEWDIVFADYTMPHFNGVAGLRTVRTMGLDMPFIFVSGTIGEDTAVEAMRGGANDYIMKGNMKRLLPTVERELRDTRMRRAGAEAEKKIHYLAFHDALTGLPNRNMVFDNILKAINDWDEKPMALLLIDLDHFRDVNDTLGHLRGDALLKMVGQRISAVMRPTDVIARLGGDEFAVFLQLASLTHATLVAKKIMKALEESFVVEGLPISVEASIGVALYPDHGAIPDNLMQRADVAMYAAKKSGSGYFIYDPRYDHHSRRRLALMGELRRAIDQNMLALHYQPKIDLKTNRVAGVEALARWMHKEYGFIPPDEFILPAERTGLIKPLTQWVLGEAKRQALAWHTEGKMIAVAVNLSARNLVDPYLPERVSELLQASGLPMDRLEMEVTESAIMADANRAIDGIKRLKAMGIRLAIDDFGTGYSSLGYLKTLPVDTIKIDKTFVMNMCNSEYDSVIVRSIIDLGHNLGLKVVAEGVENEETLARLASLGCDEAQGYCICRPQPADKLGQWLRESRRGLN